MNTVRSIFHLARADFLERTRQRGFHVTLLLIVFMAYLYVPSRYSGYITLSVDGARGVYNSAWVANLVAILAGITIPGLGFFLVKNAVARDRQTGVGQILATTPLKRPVYTLGKWLSNLFVLAVILAIIMLATIVLQIALEEDPHVQLSSLLPPLIWIIVPTIALVAGVALFFETVPWLRGGFGNIAYFFACTGVTMASFMPIMIQLGRPLLGDVLGIGRPLLAMLLATIDSVPGLDTGNTSIGPVPDSLAGQALQTFEWSGIAWAPPDILARLHWIGVGLAVSLVAAWFFDRFDPSRSRVRIPKQAISNTRPPFSEHQASVEPSVNHLTPLEVSNMRLAFGRVVWAEWGLVRKGLAKVWWFAAAMLFILGVLVPSDIALQYILPLTWLWPILAWAELGAREKQHRTEGLVFSAAFPLQRQFSALWLSGVLLTGLTGGGAAINFLRGGEIANLLTWLLAVVFIPTLAMALATWSGSSMLFQVIYLVVWYFGPVNHLVRYLDFLSTAPDIQLFYLIAVLVLGIVAMRGRIKQLRN